MGQQKPVAELEDKKGKVSVAKHHEGTKIPDLHYLAGEVLGVMHSGCHHHICIPHQAVRSPLLFKNLLGRHFCLHIGRLS